MQIGIPTSVGFAGVAAVVLLVTGASGQEPVKPATVCEVLADTKRFQGKPVAVLGRLDCIFTFESACYLVEDRCDRPSVSDDHTWPNKIWLQFIFPATPKSNVQIDAAVLDEKQALVRTSTKLGTHRVMLLKKKDGVLVLDKWSDQPDEWAVVYGRILITKALQHYSGADVALELNPNDLRSFKDDDAAERARK
jgi:hypothetical protein